ncbi:MAG: prepilin-type N-terminal cleavage/methylation domain-containing protein [Phycisphaeraceae bacterium]
MLRRNRPIGGYTLIELLVTLVIVAILLGVLLPALQRARASAQKVQCLAHQASSGKSLLLHTFERDGRFPPMFHGFSPGESGKIIVQVRPRTPKEAGTEYMDTQNMICPTDTIRGTVPIRKQDTTEHQVMSYGYNIELPIKQATLNGLARPSGTTVMFDGSMSGSGRGRNVEGTYADSYAFVETAHSARHDGAANALFADWHARTISQINADDVLLP